MSARTEASDSAAARILPPQSPLSAGQAAQLERLVRELNPQQMSWVSGYLAGLSAAAPASAVAAAAPAPQRVLTVLYGSETGNAKQLAADAAAAAEARGIPSRLFDMASYPVRELRGERLLLIVTATHGEGTPPDPALDFYEYLHSRKAPRLSGLGFAVLALGDSSYEHFCQTGKDFDERLAALGGERLTARIDCDIDFEAPAAHWLEETLGVFRRTLEASESLSKVVPFGVTTPAQSAPVWGKQRPFAAEVLENLNLNGRGSERQTHHVELSLGDSGIRYEPGDVLCLKAPNRAEVVAELLETLHLDPAAPVEIREGTMPLAEALTRHLEITTVTPGFLRSWAERGDHEALRDLLADERRAELAAFARDRWIVDVVSEFPIPTLSATELVGMLRPLAPREYSIASSLAANPEEVHLTVTAVRYRSNGRDRQGVASTHIADRLAPGDTAEIWVRSNERFRLPADPSTPIIMIGPGTGVAPFRAFMQERELTGAGGESWLFFGNPHFRTDFLYQVEWQRWLADGLLSRLDVAFSRDQAYKIYVQDRLRERGADVFDWLERGAHLYICGDAQRMAPDVHAALVDIVVEHGKLPAEAAESYLRDLQRAARYQRDVY
ncbi:MAG: assimilatory sulfite reductase (NADPH) flavoprotein subunit [Pseudomonadales bacterium]